MTTARAWAVGRGPWDPRPASDAVRTHRSLGRRAWGVTWRLLYVAGAGATFVVWGLFALILEALRCDDGCSGNQANDWRYEGQLVLAVVAIVIGLASMALVWTRHTRAFGLTLVVVTVLGLTWFEWLSAGTF